MIQPGLFLHLYASRIDPEILCPDAEMHLVSQSISLDSFNHSQKSDFSQYLTALGELRRTSTEARNVPEGTAADYLLKWFTGNDESPSAWHEVRPSHCQSGLGDFGSQC